MSGPSATAAWLRRAALVENVTDHEIKNVVTAFAKTHHDWTEHLAGLETPAPALAWHVSRPRDRQDVQRRRRHRPMWRRRRWSVAGVSC